MRSAALDPEVLKKLGFEFREPFLYAVWRDDQGKRFRRSTGCRADELQRAVEVRARLIASPSSTPRQDPDHRPQVATVGSVLAAYVGAREGLAERGIRSDNTVGYYVQKAGVLRGYFEPEANDE